MANEGANIVLTDIMEQSKLEAVAAELATKTGA
jgi:hypothetical protein